MPNHRHPVWILLALSLSGIGVGWLFGAVAGWQYGAGWLVLAGVVGLIAAPFWLLVRARKDGVL